jgi:hypothetical protein
MPASKIDLDKSTTPSVSRATVDTATFAEKLLQQHLLSKSRDILLQSIASKPSAQVQDLATTILQNISGMVCSCRLIKMLSPSWFPLNEDN